MNTEVMSQGLAVAAEGVVVEAVAEDTGSDNQASARVESTRVGEGLLEELGEEGEAVKVTDDLAVEVG
jgi:hypothetical protein